jgi:molybdopterin-guanine dinucleotide biosynthesis protein A
MYSAAILTGGRARRFGGRDKSALVVEGRTIRERQLAVLSHVADETLIIGAGDDIVAGSGPMGGVHAALTAARGDAVLVLACDMPYVTADFAGYLLGLSAEADIVIPRTDRGYHPLCSVYTGACLEPLAHRLATQSLKLTALLEDVRVRVVEGSELDRFGDRDRLLANVNTPGDYAGLAALHGHKR